MSEPQPTNPRNIREALAMAAEAFNLESASLESASSKDADRVFIRPAVAEDVHTIYGLVKELAEFEREPDAVITTPESFLRDGFPDGPNAVPLYYALLASLGSGPVVGMAVVYPSYSTWTGPCLYLEDLYVSPIARRRGVSRSLFRTLARAALAAGCARLHWSVLKWNTPALGLYESTDIAAERLEEWASYRLNKADIARVAGLSPKPSASLVQVLADDKSVA